MLSSTKTFPYQICGSTSWVIADHPSLIHFTTLAVLTVLYKLQILSFCDKDLSQSVLFSRPQISSWGFFLGTFNLSSSSLFTRTFFFVWFRVLKMRPLEGGGFSLLSKTVQTASEDHPDFSGHQGLSFGIKGLGCEVNHSLPSSAKLKNGWSHMYTHSTNLHGVNRNSFALYSSTWCDRKVTNRKSLFLHDTDVLI